MIGWCRIVRALALGFAVSQDVRAQPARTLRHYTDSVSFLQLARNGTSRFQDQQRAIDEGFTRVGVEFPAMGEHWVSFARILENTFAPEQPSVLIYVNTARGPQLAGVAYSRLVSGQATPPAFPFAGAWHEHNGAVNEESLPIGHTAHASPSRAVSESELRLYVLHAWLFAPNPKGTFATDNWTLPLRRLQGANTKADLAPLPRDAVMTIALADDDADYYRLVLNTTLGLSESELSKVAKALDDYQLRAKALVNDMRDGRAASPALTSRLSALWSALWVSLETTLPARRPGLRRLRAQM